MNKKEPFMDDEVESPQPSGVKLKNSDSIFANVPKKPSQAELDKSVADFNKRQNSYKERASELSLNFRKILEDKTLPDNKNIFAADLEKEIMGNLGQLAIDINTDEKEVEGMGSVGIITLLLRCLLIQRDKLNLLQFSVEKLENTVKSLNSVMVDKPNKDI